MSELNNASIGSQLGVGQTWQSVVRTSGTSYTNTTGRPIVLNVQCNLNAAIGITVTVQGVVISNQAIGSASWVTSSHVIPNGAVYSLTITGAGSVVCAELR